MKTSSETDRAAAIRQDALLDQSLFSLDGARWAAFTAAIDAPPRNNPALERLLAKRAPWNR